MPGVLIAYDGSAPARSAVRAAGALLPGARAVILTAHESAVEPTTGADPALQWAIARLDREILEEARGEAAAGVALAVGAGLDAEAETAPGPPWRAILAAARRAGAELIVCGMRGRGGLGRAVLGSTSSSLVHHADVPVLAVPDGEFPADGPLLLAYDGSPAARAAVAAAASLLPGRPAVSVHAWRSAIQRSLTGRAFLEAPDEEVRGLVTDLDQRQADQARERAEEGAALARERGLDAGAEAVESDGPPWSALIDRADALGASVVVTGSRGRGDLASALLGSVSAGLVHNAERPTLVVRAAPAP